MRSALLLGLVAGAAADGAPAGTYCCSGTHSMLPAFGAGGGCGKDSAAVGVSAMSIAFAEGGTPELNVTVTLTGGAKTTCPNEPYKYDDTSKRVDLTDTNPDTDCLQKFEKDNSVAPTVEVVAGDKLRISFNSTGDITLSHCSGPTKQPAGGGASGKSPAMGAIGIAVAAIGFGSNFVVIKKKEWDPKDGMFFQFNMVIGVFVMGMAYTYAVRGAPPLQPVAMLGGAMWACGNAATPFIIQSIGMGLGLSIWGSANMLTGWSSAHFGILGVSKETVPHQPLNIAGALVAVLAILIYAQVKNKEPPPPAEIAGWRKARKSYEDVLLAPSDEAAESGSGGSKVVGVAVAVIAGILFGACFNPCQYAIDQAALNHCNPIGEQAECLSAHFGSDDRTYCSWDGSADPGKQCGGMPGPDLAFSQFCGILFASFAIMAAYGTYQQFIVGDGPIFINAPLVVPAFLSGAIWACAQIGWFVASDNLSMVVSFPIITTIPAIIGNLWGYFVFDELATDTKNVVTLCLGICCSIAAGVLIALSKVQ